MRKLVVTFAAFAIVATVADARLFDRLRERRAERHESKAARIRGRMGASSCGSSSSSVTYSGTTTTLGGCANGACAVPQSTPQSTVQPRAELIPVMPSQPAAPAKKPVTPLPISTDPFDTLNQQIEATRANLHKVSFQ